jgi:uridine kinase
MKKISSIEELASEIKNELAGNNRYVIAITGFAGAGKSSISRSLKELLGDCSIIEVDNFIKSDNNGAIHGHPHDWESLEIKTLAQLKTSQSVTIKTYDWKTNKAVTKTGNLGNQEPCGRDHRVWEELMKLGVKEV